MNASAHVRVMMLEASNVDSEGVSALVGVVREFRSGGDVQTIARLAEPAQLEPSASEPAQLPAPRERKPRSPKSAAGKSHSRAPAEGRAGNAGEMILAAVRKNGRLDRPKLATAIYGNSEPKQVTKLNNMLSYFVRNGKLTKSDDGVYGVA